MLDNEGCARVLEDITRKVNMEDQDICLVAFVTMNPETLGFRLSIAGRADRDTLLATVHELTRPITETDPANILLDTEFDPRLPRDET